MTGTKQRFIKVYRGDDPTSRGKYIKDLDIQKTLVTFLCLKAGAQVHMA